LNLGGRRVEDVPLSSVLVRVRWVVDELLLLPEVSEPDVVEVSPGLMSVVTGGLVLVIVSVVVVVVVDDDEKLLWEDAVGSM
jgi:hypothetical protein